MNGPSGEASTRAAFCPYDTSLCLLTRSAVKMLLLIPLCALATCVLTHGEESEGDRGALIRFFKPEATVVLKRPFVGTIRILYPHGMPAEDASRILLLDSLIPEKDGKDNLAIQRHVLACTGTSSSALGDAYILRDKLPDVARLGFSSSSYEQLTTLFGAPTCRSKNVRKVDGWTYEVVGWKFFSPRDQKTVDVLEIGVELGRKQTEVTAEKPRIRSYLVCRGTLTQREQAAESDGGKQPN